MITNVKNSLEGFLGIIVSSIVALPDAFRVENFLIWKHVDRVEDVFAICHSKVTRRQEETPAVLLRTGEYDN